MEAYERIALIRKKFCNDSNSEFAKAIGVSVQYASNITKPGKSIGAKLINKILDAFPDINPSWLIHERGDMTNDELRHVADDGNQLFKKTCTECKKKDEEIKKWRDKYDDMTAKYLAVLEEIKDKKVS